MICVHELIKSIRGFYYLISVACRFASRRLSFSCGDNCGNPVYLILSPSGPHQGSALAKWDQTVSWVQRLQTQKNRGQVVTAPRPKTDGRTGGGACLGLLPGATAHWACAFSSRGRSKRFRAGKPEAAAFTCIDHGATLSLRAPTRLS